MKDINELPTKVYSEEQLIIRDDDIILWHVTDSDEIYYSIYTEEDGGVISVDNKTMEEIEAMLTEEI